MKKRKTALTKLKALNKAFHALLAQDNAVDIPTVAELQHQIAKDGDAWEKFDASHFAYLEAKDEEAEVEEAEYQQLTLEQTTLIGHAMEMMAVRRGESIQNAPAAASLGQQIEVAKAELEAAFEDVSAVLKAVATHIKKPDSTCRESLTVCALQLDHAEALLEGAAMRNALKELVRLKPAEAAGSTAAKAIKVGEVRMNLETLRAAVASALSKVAPQVMAAPRATVAGTAFKKRDPPKFYGLRRNYPSFKKEWLMAVTGKLDPTTEVREIRYSVPTVDEPDLKNLHSMEEIWAILDDKYGKVMELSLELIMGLQKFSYSKGAKGDSARFTELYREWTKVHNDLQQVGELSALDHKPTLCNIASMLPCPESKMRYTKMRNQLQDANKEVRSSQAAAGEELTAEPTELHIMNLFMKAEKRLQEGYEHLCGSEFEHSRTSKERSSPAQCHKCGKTGHKAADCEAWQYHPEEQMEGQGGARVAHANMKLKPRDCPCCKSQHTFFVDDGSIRYKTRLSACRSFQNMSVENRARLVEEAKGCALCLDWTGLHTRDNCQENYRFGKRFGNCEADVGGAKCGRKHNELLHGSTSKFTNHVASRFSHKLSAKVLNVEPQEEKISKLSSLEEGASTEEKRQRKSYAVRYAEAVELVREAVVQSMPSKEFLETERAKAEQPDVKPEEQTQLKESSMQADVSEEELVKQNGSVEELVKQDGNEEELVKQDGKKESLAKLLKATALRIEDALEMMEDVEIARVEFWPGVSICHFAATNVATKN